jgi:hypothetical protein
MAGWILEQVPSNKLSLILKIQLQNTQTLQLFTNTIKTESFYKSYRKHQAERFVSKTERSNQKGEEVIRTEPSPSIRIPWLKI